ncbi:MAG: archaeosortase A [Methanosarcinales archaeon]|nr:archaeosortase A [Methanosarcinales archaeon]
MIVNFLWMALIFFILAAILPSKFKSYRMPIGGMGWIFFAAYWALQPFYYLKEGDFSMVILMLVVALICLIIAHLMFITYLKSNKGMLQDNQTNITKTLMAATTVTAIGALFYFPFAQIESLNHSLISTVTSQTFWLSQQAGFPVIRLDWNMIMLEGYRVEIILACTAIESIALFFGLILGIKADRKKVLMALMASIPVIYILNLIRNTFVIGAYGYKWFGTGPMIVHLFGNEYFLHQSASFYIGHHIIAKGGSGVALLFIAYAVLKLLPELLDLIDNLWLLIKEDVRNIFRSD